MNKEIRNGLAAITFALTSGFVGRVTQDTDCSGPTEFLNRRDGRIAVCEEGHGYRVYQEDGTSTSLPELESPNRVTVANSKRVSYYTVCGGVYEYVTLNSQTGELVSRYESYLPYSVVENLCSKE